MRKSKQKPVKDTRPPVAISYIRFSSPEQRKGDSLRRQTQDTERWCQANGVPLDTKLSCRDAGRSAYHGKHRSDKAALGNFLELVKEGKVPRGSFLVIENLDRLSREDERTALRLWLDILDAGISIVQLHPETVFRHDKSDMVDIMRAIIELSRGHSESRMKSVRTLANWERLVKLAREENQVITRRLPAWVELTDSGLQLVAERACVVKQIFAWATAGYGMASIVKKLNDGGIPAFGDRVLVEDDDGNTYWQAAKGARYGCGEWRTSYVRSILSDRRALGEFQPYNHTEGTKRGDAIANYFPQVVSEAEFYAARAAVLKRKNQGSAAGAETNRQGRIGNGVACLFSGLMRHARDGSTYYVGWQTWENNRLRVLINKTSRESTGRAYTFPYDPFERKILECLREIDPREIVSDVPITEVSVLQGQLNELRERKAALALELLKGDVAEIGDALRQLKAQEDELVAQIDDNAERTAAPRSNAWETVHTLVDLIDTAEDKEDVRLRLRAAIRRTVESMHILIVPRGRVRLAAVQIFFAEGERREYLIYRKAPHAGGFGGRTEEVLEVESLSHVADADDLDLRDPQQAAELARDLENLDAELLKQVLTEL